MHAPSKPAVTLALFAGALAMGTGCGLADRAQAIASSLIGEAEASEPTPTPTPREHEDVTATGTPPAPSNDAAAAPQRGAAQDAAPLAAAAKPALPGTETTAPLAASSASSNAAPTPTPVATHATTGPCIAGDWTLSEAPWLTAAVRRQAQGRPVVAQGKLTGVVSMHVDVDAGTVSLDADRFGIRHRANLAGNDVRYATRIHGQARAAVHNLSDDKLELTSKRRLRASVQVEFNGKEPTHRTVALPLAGTMRVDCDGDSLSLTPTRGLRHALTFTRSPKSSV